MKPVFLSHRDVRIGIGALALAGIGLGASGVIASRAQAPAPAVDTTLHGLQTVYLRAPIQRYFAGVSSAPSDLSPASLTLANFSVGSNRRLYPHLDQVRAAISEDPALTAFLKDPQVGPSLRQALQEATLYASLPRPGLTGFNDYNAMSGAIRRLPVRAGKKKNAAGSPAAQSGGAQAGTTVSAAQQSGASVRPSDTATKQAGFLADVQQAAAQNATTGVGSGTPGGNGAIAARVATARQAMVRDFSTFVALSPDGKQANLYVIGSLPSGANSSTPFNFTVVGKQYNDGDRDAAGLDRASSQTVVDKQAIPIASGGTRYFLYVYPLATPSSGTQSNLMISYWPDPSVAATHGVAFVHNGAAADAAGPAAQWITVPMTRLQRFQPRKTMQYTLLSDTDPGDPMVAAYRNVVRQAVLGAKRKNRTP